MCMDQTCLLSNLICTCEVNKPDIFDPIKFEGLVRAVFFFLNYFSFYQKTNCITAALEPKSWTACWETCIVTS